MTPTDDHATMLAEVRAARAEMHRVRLLVSIGRAPYAELAAAERRLRDATRRLAAVKRLRGGS